MKGTIFDFLELAVNKPDLAKELVELAARHGFEFAAGELSDAELEAVAGGGIREYQIVSTVLKRWQSTAKEIINNVR